MAPAWTGAGLPPTRKAGSEGAEGPERPRRVGCRVQFGERLVAGLDAGPQNARSAKMWETADVAQPGTRRPRGASDPAQSLVDRRQFSRLDVSQELQGQVHRIGVNPTNVGTAGAQLGDDSRQPLLDGIRQI